ncbi:uncharacterized protein ASPGLDRAFT_51566 [Aspergillus glaucus CBS 516.65]|uniref:Uncharacterized protein n=1 Tax=Aspergillus glaucus CBS 516.65 TaxID=1160497 RepID=A0A1L9V8T4_ASPGL|nr:hypothetical protein ASPGLDRAFT_51566 [Aspergillus glaucus CBS 516.65]OJJ80356.1 hypothetical protein ASPGLDRAFT_51566 [Aspergillus glaucus CBS 516.65]
MEPDSISQQTRPRFARKYGRSYHHFGQLSSASLASRNLGKVRVDCRFRLSESQWGVLNQYTPAGVLYVDLNFDQPQDCRLRSATVLVTLEKEQPAFTSTVLNHDTLQLTDYYGPKHLNGEPTTLPRKRVYQLMPEVNAMGCSSGGVGVNSEKTTNEVRRWMFTGQLMPGKAPNNAVTYRTLKWELTENELDSQSFHNNVIRTGFAFEHDRETFRIRVEIQGKLQKRTRQLKESWKDKTQHFKFPSEANRDQGSAVTLVDVRETKQFHRNLDRLAMGLPHEMIRRNQLEVPVEVPNSMPSLFQGLPSASHSPDIQSQASMNMHCNNEHLDGPSAQDPISATRSIDSESQGTEPSIHSSPSSSTTLVDGQDRPTTSTASPTAAADAAITSTSDQPVKPYSCQPPLSPFLVILRMLEAIIASLILRLEPAPPRNKLDSSDIKQKIAPQLPEKPKGSR